MPIRPIEFSRLIERLDRYERLMRLDKPIGILLLLTWSNVVTPVGWMIAAMQSACVPGTLPNGVTLQLRRP